MNFTRYLKFQLPSGQSAFLWGARKTGKSSFLKTQFPSSLYYDLLQTDLYLHYLKTPSALREEILALGERATQQPVIIDEIQRVPMLLNEVHWLIENARVSFILCGSSARQLKRQGSNMLGGRAWRYHFYPLVFSEIPEFDLLKALNRGLIPSHYLAEDFKKAITAYVQDYLMEEIKAESLTRNLLAFSRFLELAAHSNGETLNFSNIARDCGVDSKTIKEYYQILVDTLLGYYLEPYHPKIKRNHLTATQKFYLFDIGVVNGLCKRDIPELKGALAGKALEHYILMELLAYRGLNGLDFKICYWRTQSGQEVDFVLGDGEVAIEVKISDSPHQSDLHGIIAFAEDVHPRKSYVVCNTPRARMLTIQPDVTLELLPYREFLTQLWQGNITQEVKSWT